MRASPIILGVDYAGTIVADVGIKVGDVVVLTGRGVGEKHSGGFAQYARIRRVADNAARQYQCPPSHGL
ncbi:MAG: hypothetical protein ACNYPH_04820 [Gammaproteobacteria bacterium WSBS_2016_MAG_OTU1]